MQHNTSVAHTHTVCSEGYGLLFESSVTFLMLCWTQTLCWSSSCSLRARSSSSAFRSISLSAISLVLQPGPTPLKHKGKHMVMYRQQAKTNHTLVSTHAVSHYPASSLKQLYQSALYQSLVKTHVSVLQLMFYDRCCDYSTAWNNVFFIVISHRYIY